MTSTGFDIRTRHFGDVMDFYAPGLKEWSTPEWKPVNPQAVPASVGHRVGVRAVLRPLPDQGAHGMAGIPSGESLFDVAARMKASGSEGLLVSGGSTPQPAECR